MLLFHLIMVMLDACIYIMIWRVLVTKQERHKVHDPLATVASYDYTLYFSSQKWNGHGMHGVKLAPFLIMDGANADWASSKWWISYGSFASWSLKTSEQGIRKIKTMQSLIKCLLSCKHVVYHEPRTMCTYHKFTCKTLIYVCTVH